MIKTQWPIVRLDSVAKIQTGISKSSSRKLKEPIELPYLRVANVQDGFLDLNEIKTISIEKDKQSRYLLEFGDVLLTEGGDFDKLGRGTVWKGEINNCVHQNHVFVVRPDTNLLLSQFLSILTSSEYGKKYFISCSKQSTNLASINSTQLKAFPVLLPDINTQKEVINVLEKWGAAIEKTEALITAKQKQFEWLKCTLLSKSSYDNGWNIIALGDLIKERNEKSVVEDQYPCLTSSRRGILLQNQYFSKQVASKNNIGYKIVYRGDFTFRSMSDDGIFVFNQQSIVDNGIISPAYAVFYIQKGVNADFLYYLLNSALFRRSLKKIAQGGTRTALKLNEIKKVNVEIPDLSRQISIAKNLNTAKHEITLLKSLLEMYQAQKRGLMQKLLTGEWRIKTKEVA